MTRSTPGQRSYGRGWRCDRRRCAGNHFERARARVADGGAPRRRERWPEPEECAPPKAAARSTRQICPLLGRRATGPSAGNGRDDDDGNRPAPTRHALRSLKRAHARRPSSGPPTRAPVPCTADFSDVTLTGKRPSRRCLERRDAILALSTSIRPRRASSPLEPVNVEAPLVAQARTVSARTVLPSISTCGTAHRSAHAELGHSRRSRPGVAGRHHDDSRHARRRSRLTTRRAADAEAA